jgi:hypothetical protein
VALVAGLGAAGAVMINLPAGAQVSTCERLQASYIAHPEAQPQLAEALAAFGCSVPTSSTSSSSTTSSSTTSSSTTTTAPTTTTTVSVAQACAVFQAAYIAAPMESRPTILPLLLGLGCTVPGGGGGDDTSTSSSSSSSTSTSITIPTTIVGAQDCASLLAAYNAFPQVQQSLLPALQALGCLTDGTGPIT